MTSPEELANILQAEKFQAASPSSMRAKCYSSSDKIGSASKGLTRGMSWHSGAPTHQPLRRNSTDMQRRISFGVKPTYTTNPHAVLSDRVVIAMVGLPARGKSYISKAIVRYLNFLGCPAKLFNAGNKRRQEGAAGVDASFFDASNKNAKAQREQMAMETLDELLEWIHSVTTPEAGCAFGIFDATNTTLARREKVRRRMMHEVPTVKLVFLELVCNDVVILNENYRMKLSNDDYKGTDPARALADFKERVRQYEMVYEPCDDTIDCRPLTESMAEEAAEAKFALVAAPPADFGGQGSYEEGPLSPRTSLALGSTSPTAAPGCVQMIDAGRKLIVSSCEGFVVNELLSLLHSIHLGHRCIWITLVGETTNDLQGVLGGDSPASPDGLEYARAVRAHIETREASEDLRDSNGRPPPPAMVLTGTLRRNVQMAEVLCADPDELPLLMPERSARSLSSLSVKEETSPERSPTDRAVAGRPLATAWQADTRHGGTEAAAAAARSTASSAAAAGAPAAHGSATQRISLQLHRLNELCAGKLDSLTYEQMRQLYPTEYQARARDKLNYRYPGAGGESYMDLIMRLESAILMLEQTRGNVVVACDRAVCRVLLGYFRGLSDLEELPFIDVNAGVIELRRSHSGFSTTHTSITSGRTTRAAGPGTHGQGLDQLSNRLSSKAVLAGAGSSGKLLASEYP